MSETFENIWTAADIEINVWLGDGVEAYCFTDKAISEFQDKFIAVRLINSIGLKRRIGKILKARGYTKTSSSPPTWVLHPLVKPVSPIPRYVVDTYLSLLQAQSVIEREFPDIVEVSAR